MFGNNVNYMDEIKRIEEAIDQIDESAGQKTDMAVKSRLQTMLYNLEKTADEMASYISGNYDDNFIDFLKQSNAGYIANNDYQNYLSGLTQLLRLERTKLICSTLTPDEKSYFLIEYEKHKEKRTPDEKEKPKVR